MKMLGDPDAEFSKQVYGFNGKVMVFLVGLEKKLIECGIEKPADLQGKQCAPASYADNRGFYLETVPLGLAELRLRAGANPPNETTLRSIDELEAMLEEFRVQHQKNQLLPRYVQNKRLVINEAFVQILLLEKAKEIAQPRTGKK
ncbi:MAG: hypothetical protein C4525_01875 [Desulfarculus sp.]|nr:MAG: hypothetical protein C4525_01875 [Desulfarculus sp.]